MGKKNRSLTDEGNIEYILVSKSEMKRDMAELQKLGEAIVKLKPGEFSTIPITDETLAEAIETARRIKHREGLRRQMQYIGKLMRNVDIEPMQQAYDDLQKGRKKQADHFHKLEQWRDHLIAEGISAVESVIEKYPHGDRQHLRQLILQAAKESKNNKPPAAARKLFQYIRELDNNVG